MSDEVKMYKDLEVKIDSEIESMENNINSQVKLSDKELRSQFEEEFGPEYTEEEAIRRSESEKYEMPEEEKKKYCSFEEALSEALGSMFSDDIDHFIGSRSRTLKDEGRYYYTKDELKKVISGFKEKGGDVTTLHIGKVYNDSTGDLLCWEICRKKYYEDNPEMFFS